MLLLNRLSPAGAIHHPHGVLIVVSEDGGVQFVFLEVTEASQHRCLSDSFDNRVFVISGGEDFLYKIAGKEFDELDRVSLIGCRVRLGLQRVAAV